MVLCLLSGLGGCVDGLLPFGAGGPTAGEAGRAVPVARQARLGAGAVIVAPPRGYCIDKSSIRNRGDAAFALIASCESLTGRMGGVLVEPAVITVSVSGARAGRDQPEAALLARALPEGAPLRETNGDGLTVVQVEGDSGALPGARGDVRHWRGAMVLNDRLVGLAVYGADGSDVAGTAGERLLVAMAEQIREKSPMRLPRADAATAAQPATEEPRAPRPLGGLLQRLFP
jgi:hypothetical protein